MLAWAMANPAFKTQLFRLVDVLPSCRDEDDVLRHLEEYFDGIPVPRALDLGIDVAEHVPFGAAVTATVARRSVRRMARQFIVGTTPARALPRLARLWERGEAATVDMLGEKVVAQAEADRYAARLTELVETLARGAPAWPSREVLERDPWGTLSRVNVSVKPTALSPCFGPLTADVGLDEAVGRLRPVLELAPRVRCHRPPGHRARRRQGPDPRAPAPRGRRVPRGAAGLRDPGLPQGCLRRPARRRVVVARCVGAPPPGQVGQGRVLGPRAHRRRRGRVAGAGVRAQGRDRRELRALHALPRRPRR